MKKLLILDSNSIINRAFYGIRFLSASDGTPTNAVYGFMNIFLKLLNEEKPDYVCAAFDVKAPTFRHKMYDAYKAQRRPMPDELAVQMPLAKDILKAMNIPILELAGYEADDIIGTVSAKCEQNGIKCMIATGDKDDLQLASENTNVILTVSKLGNTDTVIYDDKAVFEKYGVTPEEFIDVKALMGDTSDNIPGVAGVGEKTAIKLISEFKSIKNLYENIDSPSVKGALLKKLTEGRDSAFLSRELAEIDRNIPIAFSFDDCIFNGEYKTEELTDILSRLELAVIMKRLGLEKATAPKTDIFKNLKISGITSKAELEELGKTLSKCDKVGVMLRISGNVMYEAALSYGDSTAYVKASGDIGGNDILRFIKELFLNDNVLKIVFDIKDVLVSFFEELSDSRNITDCAIAGYIINPAGSTSVERMCDEYLGADVLAEEKPQKQLSLLDDEDEEETDTVLCKRAYALIPLWEKFYEKIKGDGQEDLFFNIEMPLVFVLASMQVYGFKIDRESLEDFGKNLDTLLSRLSDDIYKASGEEFNINSPKQLGEILFEKLGLPVIKKTKSGYSTNAEVLEKLRAKHAVIPMIMDYRTYSKLKSTYCDGLAAVISKETGKIHSVFNQTVTVTGRISSTEPNMQNIPVRTELGRELRKMFTASDDEHILVDADYSQIELRVLAHIADDEKMIQAFLSGEDIHTVTASQVFGVSTDEVTSAQRSDAKAVNFGIVYGIGEYSLSQDLKIPVKQAKQYIESYLEKYSGVRSYMTNIKKQAAADGFVKTLMNRVRYIPELKASNFNVKSFGERVALNTPIQGTAADIIKLAMVRVYTRIKSEGLKSRLILQVHDELIIDAYKPEKEKVEKILKEEMENAMELRVPLLVDMHSGDSWYEAK